MMMLVYGDHNIYLLICTHLHNASICFVTIGFYSLHCGAVVNHFMFTEHY